MSCSGPATALRQAARCPSRLASERRAFSSTPSQNEMSRLRTTMYEWLNKLEGQMARKEGTQYIGGNDQPFPNNPFFRSQAVLDENARETIWRRVQRKQEPMKVVSADMGVDVRRVAAVVRLKEIEKSWMAKVRLALPPSVYCFYEHIPPPFMMIHNYSISLEDIYMVTNTRHSDKGHP
ncbi:hypothetical protein IMZ48_35180 [Candidatus Bathyarchaeota archaeon]|nr:hypothetical protein [Candidatus Bathyarchaeota archaeon]